ncbi:hypothetical protein F383_34290 [Gossypium arboreum]|uniref:Uncharacterized protein n=1 Tax=Gossypium arboreum TaxID=29729 RepID=A0A0B0N3W3_GOSAR|nr:hypothetical protein F383_34290 [Gossypium arboreum]
MLLSQIGFYSYT